VISTDAFALKNSNLNAFLFADVGTELNGSTLTILSVLARLGLDPWAEAARWAKMPSAAAIDCLAQGIGKMPLSPQALAETFATASSLVKLLPAQTQPVGHGGSSSRGRTLTALVHLAGRADPIHDGAASPAFSPSLGGRNGVSASGGLY